MTTKIITKNSQTPASAPLAGDLEVGELAVNTADQLLYTKQTDGTIIEVGKTTELETLKAPKASPVFTGNVGIGTTTPVQPLHLIGNMRIDNGLIDMRGTGIRQLNFQNGISFTETGVAERARIDSTGDVEVTTLNKGVIVKSPNGTRWRITVDNAGNIATATV
jgi:hypothetical protein